MQKNKIIMTDDGCRKIIDVETGNVFYVVEGIVRQLVERIRQEYKSSLEKIKKYRLEQDKYCNSLLSEYKMAFPKTQDKNPEDIISFPAFFHAYTGARLKKANSKVSVMSGDDFLSLYKTIATLEFRKRKNGFAFKNIDDMCRKYFKRKVFERIDLDETKKLISIMERSQNE